jgi:hypothetical protein
MLIFGCHILLVIVVLGGFRRSLLASQGPSAMFCRRWWCVAGESGVEKLLPYIFKSHQDRRNLGRAQAQALKLGPEVHKYLASNPGYNVLRLQERRQVALSELQLGSPVSEHIKAEISFWLKKGIKAWFILECTYFSQA